MPWETRDEMEQRKAFVAAAQRHEMSFSALCRQYGISRKTGYKWCRRSESGQSLKDQSRRPVHQPHKTDKTVEQLILSVRAECPAWGGKTIKTVLENAGYEHIPSAKTCSNILKRNGCIDPAETLKRKPYTRFEREQCNRLWQIDFKGDFALGDGSRCYPLDVIDDHSRFCILLDPKRAQTGVIESITDAFREYGLPEAILSDNGAQFAGPHKGLSLFERYLMDLDILPIHGRVMHPQTQGKIERFHRTMKQEALRIQPKDMAAAKKQLKQWRWRYNEIRPHSALGMKPPASVYETSQRPFVKPMEYDYPSGARMIKLNNWGYLRFGPIRVFLSESFADTYLEIRPADHDTFDVIYRNYIIASIDAVEQKLLNRHIRKL